MKRKILNFIFLIVLMLTIMSCTEVLAWSDASPYAAPMDVDIKFYVDNQEKTNLQVNVGETITVRAEINFVLSTPGETGTYTLPTYVKIVSNNANLSITPSEDEIEYEFNNTGVDQNCTISKTFTVSANSEVSNATLTFYADVNNENIFYGSGNDSGFDSAQLTIDAVNNSNTTINSLNITIANPKVGDEATNNTKPVVTIEENAGYVIDWIAYITAYPSVLPEGYDAPFVGTFEKNTSYVVEVSLVTEGGYVFTDNAHMTLTVNGKTTDYEMNEWNSNGSPYYMFYTKVDAVEDNQTPENNEDVGEPVFTVIYDFNGGNRHGESTYTTTSVGFVPVISVSNFIDWIEVTPPNGKELEAIEINGVRYELNSYYELNKDTTYKYIWKGSGEEEVKKCNVVFNSNGGTQIANQTVDKGSKANKPTDPTKEYYIFGGWYVDSTLSTPFDFSTPIVQDTTLYAKWTFNISVKPENKANVTEKATEAVEKLIEKVVSGKAVEGMSVALVGKINDAITAGKAITIEVTTPEVEESAVKEDAEKVKAKINDNTVVLKYYDIDVNVLVDGVNVGTVTKLGDKITMELVKPTELPTVPEGYKRVFKVIRVHDGVVTELETKDNGNTVSCDSDLFSTYVLTYEDVKEGTTTSKSPKTGDNIALWSGLVLVSVIGVLGTTKYLRKRD